MSAVSLPMRTIADAIRVIADAEDLWRAMVKANFDQRAAAAECVPGGGPTAGYTEEDRLLLDRAEEAERVKELLATFAGDLVTHGATINGRLEARPERRRAR